VRGPGYDAGMMTWLAPVLISSSLLFACGADKGGGDTTSGESTGAASSATTEGGSSGEVVTTGGEQCPAIGCGECAGGCAAEQSCVDGEVICDCSLCPATTSGGSSSSDSASSEPGSTGEPSTTGGTTGETTGETTGGGGPIQCTADPQVFPEFDRSCMNNRDCTIVLHQVDCCGSLVAWGLHNDAGKPFAEAEAVCQEQFPDCDCAPKLTVCDDGKATEDVGQIGVACMKGSCGTFLP